MFGCMKGFKSHSDSSFYYMRTLNGSVTLFASLSSCILGSVSPYASADDKGPIVNEAQVDEITSDEPSKLDEIITKGEEEKRKNEYSVCYPILL